MTLAENQMKRLYLLLYELVEAQYGVSVCRNLVASRPIVPIVCLWHEQPTAPCPIPSAQTAAQESKPVDVRMASRADSCCRSSRAGESCGPFGTGIGGTQRRLLFGEYPAVSPGDGAQAAADARAAIRMAAIRPANGSRESAPHRHRRGVRQGLRGQACPRQAARLGRGGARAERRRPPVVERAIGAGTHPARCPRAGRPDCRSRQPHHGQPGAGSRAPDAQLRHPQRLARREPGLADRQTRHAKCRASGC